MDESQRELKELLHASQNPRDQTSAIPGLHPTFSAMYNDSSSGRSECEPETRKEALATIFTWILGSGHPDLSAFPPPVLDVDHHRLIMWLYALAGAGKSTLAQTTAEWCALRRILAASFFCARDGDRSNVLAIMPTIAHQLARLCDVFREALRKAVADNPNVHQMSVASQLQTLIVRPLHEAVEGGSQAFENSVVIVDALDECMDVEAVSVVVKSLSLHHEHVAPLKFLITSRPEPNIKAGFILPTLAANTQVFPLSMIPDDRTKHDISLFIRRRLQEIASRDYLGSGWPSEAQLQDLVCLTELLFIFAATAVRFIGDLEAMDPEGRLLELLRAGSEAAAIGNSKTSPFRILDALYLQVLTSVRKLLGEAALAQLRVILGAVVLAKERLGPAALEALLNLSRGAARRFLSRLNAILILPGPGDESSPIRLIHLSFINFIVDSTRCTEPAFLINPALHHALLAKGCFRILHTLRHNICDVDPKHGHLLNSEIPNLQEMVARHLTPERQYAVKYWAHHLRYAAVDEELLSVLQAFCDSHLLDWIEALSLLGCVDVAVAALQSAQQKLKNLDLLVSITDAPELLYDCERIVRAFYEGISMSFFEVLRATATFAPLSSPLRQGHAVNLPGMVLLRRGRETAWSAILTSSASESRVGCLDFSPDGNVIACGTQGGTIQLRNVQTGAETHVMAGVSWIISVCFSPDGQAILSGHVNGSVTLWDVATGACLGIWRRHYESIRSVAWSPDGTLAASASDDGKIVLWSIASPEESTTLSGHNRCVNSVVFASDATLVSGSDDKTCKVWNTRTNSLLRTLEHDSEVRFVAVSPNSQIVACGQWNGEITLWSKVNGAKLHILPGSLRVISLAFHTDDALAAAYFNSSPTLWDVRTKEVLPVSNLLTNFATVDAVAFSPDGVHIGVSTDVAMHIIRWPTDASAMLQLSVENTGLSTKDSRATATPAARGHGHPELLGLSVSPDGRFIVAVLKDELFLSEVSTGDVVHTLKYRSGNVSSPIVWSSGAIFVAWGDEKDVCVWETKPGGRIKRLTGHSHWVRAVHFTRDDQHVLFASWDDTIRRWNVHDEHPSPTIVFGCDGNIHELAVSSDGKWMLSGSLDRSPPDTSRTDLLAKPSRKPFKDDGCYPTLRLHDASGYVLWIEHVTSRIVSLAFSNDCTHAMAGLRNSRVLLYDLTQLLPHRTRSSDVFSPLSHPGSALIHVPKYKFSIGSWQDVEQISFSPDGQGVVTRESYTILPAKLRPRYMDLSLPPAYFYKDGWLWSSVPDIGGQRLCWIPPAFRHDDGYSDYSWSVHGHIIACDTRDKSVVILDASYRQRPCAA
ncbi:WD40 repeat-like protein [Trametes coccinea BRFM310]|uniref:WD40 repeat-like protein n=1 Tax=Trametes coccinea (strain BRFM310) TaxID=1353009 RepID=A0A1Y2I9R1_TRAC3|nr:WD40 repeat-like protein [Trametes coccinea BRFM310]